MKVIYRLGYYLVGLSMGLILVSVVFSGKRTTCNYGPQARVLSTLGAKKVVLSEDFQQRYPEFDSLRYQQLLQTAQVDFSKNTLGLDSCKIYTLTVGDVAAPQFLQVENCPEQVTVLRLD
ncbi:MAG: DUF4258 domain-containing protein [Flavobacteriaceae bacterium]